MRIRVNRNREKRITKLSNPNSKKYFVLDSSSLIYSKSIKTLSLANNRNLDAQLALTLLQFSCQCPLAYICIQGCSLSGPVESSLMDAIITKLSCEYPLRSLAFSWTGMDGVDLNSLVQIWTTRWQDQARQLVRGSYVKLSVDDTYS